MSASGTLLHGTRSEDGAGSLLAQSTSSKRFPDGARYRVEIPSVEGFRALAAVLEEAEARCVPVRRISQGRGVMLLTGREIREMAKQGQAGLI